ncbi:MAG: hypothetical protein U5J82_07560 [Desulfobacterales bacterium]|nr:hypothetical protein [Desulfobacterales bacterium]
MLPLLPLVTGVTSRGSSSQYQALPEVYVQNASLVAGRRVTLEGRTIEPAPS